MKIEKFFNDNGLTVFINSYGMSVLTNQSKKEVSPRFAGEQGLKMWAMRNMDRIIQSI